MIWYCPGVFADAGPNDQVPTALTRLPEGAMIIVPSAEIAVIAIPKSSSSFIYPLTTEYTFTQARPTEPNVPETVRLEPLIANVGSSTINVAETCEPLSYANSVPMTVPAVTFWAIVELVSTIMI